MSLPNNDLLSAFHDGEVDSAERAAVERCLAESAEARRELSETRQVSSLLKELPRERLPVEFPQQVLQTIEREMLIPSLPSGSNASPPTSYSSRRWIGAAAVLTSAAGLLLLVRAIDDRDAIGRREFASAPKMSSSPAEFRLNSEANVAASAPMAADAVTDERPAGGFGGGAAAGAGPSPASVASRETDALFFDQSSLKDAKIGDVVRAMQTEGTEVAVVWLTVVDRQEGLAGLQFLLADNRIARAETNSKVPNSKVTETRKAKSAKPKGNADQMHAVFVESDAEHLAAALKQLRDQSFVQSLEVDQPIELAQLEDAGAGFDAVLSTRRSMTTAVTDPAKKIAAAPAPVIAPKSATTLSKTDSAVSEQLAQQTTLEVPRETLLQNSLNQLSRNRSNVRNAPRAEVADQKSADKAPAEQRPMQVLFVIVDQAQAGKSASPNNAPKTNPPAKARTEPAKPNGQDGAA